MCGGVLFVEKLAPPGPTPAPTRRASDEHVLHLVVDEQHTVPPAPNTMDEVLRLQRERGLRP